MTDTIRVDSVTLGKRLRDARVAAGLTQEQAAGALEIARTTIVAIEQGSRRVQPAELLALSRAYGVSSNSLLQSGIRHAEVLARFRRDLGAAQKDASSRTAVTHLAQLVSASAELESMLGRTMATHYPPEFPLGAGDVVRQAEDAALDLRHRLGIGVAPVEDVLSLFELELGLRIFVRPIDSRISGVYAYSPELGAAILVNAKHSRRRRVMTITHEAAHFLVSRSTIEVLDETVVEDAREERFATHFALAFLMPSVAVRRRFQDACKDTKSFSARHLILLAHTFHVSTEAMSRRLELLGLLPRGTYDRLIERGFSSDDVRAVLGDPEREDRPIVSPRLSSLVAEAYQRTLVSEEQLCERLGMTRSDIRSMLSSLDALAEE